MEYNFAKEDPNVLIEYGMPLFQMHFSEISANQDIPLEPDMDAYRQIAANGALRVFTIREDGKNIIGYAVFFVKSNAHYKSSIQAVQDILFIRKDKRGFGREFVNWCDKQLKDEGVQVVYHHVKLAHNWGHMLEELDYKPVETIYARRLDLWQ